MISRTVEISRTVKIIVGLAATGALVLFIVGLAISISTGFAGFWGGLPFWVIITVVLSLAVYDFWDECVRKK